MASDGRRASEEEALNVTIRPLLDADRGYVVSSWRESAKAAPRLARLPWSYYKHTTGAQIQQIANATSTVILGAYHGDELVGWLAMTPSKRVHTVHWVHTRFRVGTVNARRRGVMTALLDAAKLGARFVYTMQARKLREKLPDGTTSKSLDDVLVVALRERGVHATYVPLKDWLQ